ncbi:MAG: SufS family cysteine desulfurase [Candidatus Levybacteria bacterium]|nr:SufS family cysteine desulfurase [Candidatus Levybacteria bacterium]
MNIKKDFPIFAAHKDLVYLDSASTSQKPQRVIDEITNFYTAQNANVRRGLYPLSEKATVMVEKARKKIARFINAFSADEVIFVRNTTEAINLVSYSLVSHNIKRGERIAATIMEHHSNFVPWQQVALQKSARFGVLDINENFQLHADFQKIKLLAITHVSNVLGTINPIRKIIATARKQNPDIIVLVDAAQSVPHMKVDVRDLDCDFLAFSGHKMLAGTGVGILYGKKKLLDKMDPFLFGGEMIQEVTAKKTTFITPPARFEAGTPDIAGIIGLGAAIDYLEDVGIDKIQKHERQLMEYCLENMDKLCGLTIYGPKDGTKRSGVISFNIEGIHAHDVAQVLGDMGICIRSGHHCAMPLHNRLGVSATARASFYLYNDEQDIDKFIKGLRKAKKIFKLKK